MIANGVQMEAFCVECGKAEDCREWFMFNVFCYNVQPGLEIDYLTGAITLPDCVK